MVTDLGSAPTCPREPGQVSEPPLSHLWTWEVFPTLLSSQSRVGMKGLAAEMVEKMAQNLAGIFVLGSDPHCHPGA